MMKMRRSAGWYLALACATTVAPLAGQESNPPLGAAAMIRHEKLITQSRSVGGLTLVFADATIQSALRTIADSAGLRLLVRDDILPSGRISLRVRNASIDEALRQTLQGTSLVAEVTPTGLLVVTTRSSETAAMAPGTIAGTVTDAASGRPITAARITLDGGAKGATTGENGSFRLANITPGEHSIVIRRLGYSPATRRITVGDGATATVNVALQVAASTLDQVVVTGTVVATERRAVPNAITVITAQDIERRGITNIDQLFRGEVPGVFDQSRGEAGTSTNGYGLSYLTARGVSTVGSNATATVTPIKTYIDGVEIAYPFYLSAIDPRTIERVELIPGPQASTIYGSGALGGVLQIFTKRGSSGAPKLLLSLSSGEVQSSYNNSYTPRNDFSGQFSGSDNSGFSYSGGGGYQYTGQWLPNVYKRDANGFAAGRYAPNPKISADVSLRVSQRAVGSNSYTFLTAGEQTGQYALSPGDLAPNNVSYTVKTQTNGLGLTWQPLSWWQHRLVVGTDETNEGSFKNNPTFLTAADTFLTVVLTPSRKQTLQYNTTASGQLNDNISGNLTAGFDAMQYESTLSLASSPALSGVLSGGAASPPYIQRTTEANRGAFAQAQVAFWNALFLTGGLRAEHNSNYGRTYGTNYAPRYGASIVHELGPITAKLRAAYGRATRAPASGARESIFLTNTTYGTYQSQIASPNLGPEFQAGTEGGLELYYGTRASLQITHYDQHVDNLIIGVPVDSAPSLNPNVNGVYSYVQVTQKQNVGAVRNTGWEGQAQLNLFTGFDLTGTWSNTITRFQHLSSVYKCSSANTAQADQCLYPGAGLFNLAEHTGAVSANFARSRLNLNTSVSFIGQRHFAYDIGEYYAATNGRLFTQVYTFSPVTAAGYATFDVRGSYQLTRQVQGTLLVQNAGNSHEGDYTGRRFLPAIGRSTMIGLRITQ
jgi:outer membrane receptor protein involved in Fe transport